MNAVLEMDLKELEQIDVDDKEEIERSKERYKITNLESANWAFRKLRAIEEQKKEIEELVRKETEPYKLEISKIEEWKDKELKQYDNSINFFNFLLEEYYREQRTLDPKFKLSTPHGKVSSRKQQPKWNYNDEVILESLKVNKLDQFIRIKEEVNKADLKKETTILEYEYGYIAVFEGEVLGKVAAYDENGEKYLDIDTGEIYNTIEEPISLYERVVIYDGKVIEGIEVEPQPDSISIKGGGISMDNNKISTQETNSMMIIDGLKLDRVTDSMDKINQFQKVIQGTLVEGHDYGAAFLGSSKPSLLKPGAEKILMLLGLSSEYEIMEKIQDYDEGFFAYTIRCVLTKGGQVITEGLGHCNSKEKKYESEKQDKYMLGNTCLKMAKKRAQVDAALTVGSLSNIFTQDLEDMAQFDKAERIETMDDNDAENIKITFGKHKGKKLLEIYESDEGYVEWLADNAREEVVRKAAAMLLSPPNNITQAAKETLEKHHPGAVVDMETGEIKDEADLPWNADNDDIPF